MNTLDNLWLTVEENKGTPETLLVWADALHEAGKYDLEYAARWMAKRNRWPNDVDSTYSCWWSKLTPGEGYPTSPRWKIPEPIFPFAASSHWVYEDAYKCIDFLASRLKHLRSLISI